MAFKDQTLGNLFEAKASAEAILKEEVQEVTFERRLTVTEAVILQGASHLIVNRNQFSGLDLLKLVPFRDRYTYSLLDYFSDKIGLFCQEQSEGSPKTRSNYLYSATDLGLKVLQCFSNQEE